MTIDIEFGSVKMFDRDAADALVARAEVPDEAERKFMAAGFELFLCGAGMKAYGKYYGDQGGFLIVTDGDGCSAPSIDDDVLILSLYAAEEDLTPISTQTACSIDEALRIADEIFG